MDSICEHKKLDEQNNRKNVMGNIRKRSGLKAKDVAKQLGVTRTTLWNYENGLRDPSFSTIVKLARIYGVSVADFTDDGGDNNDKR